MWSLEHHAQCASYSPNNILPVIMRRFVMVFARIDYPHHEKSRKTYHSEGGNRKRYGDFYQN